MVIRTEQQGGQAGGQSRGHFGRVGVSPLLPVSVAFTLCPFQMSLDESQVNLTVKEDQFRMKMECCRIY